MNTVNVYHKPNPGIPAPAKGHLYKDDDDEIYIIGGDSQPVAIRLYDGQTYNSHCSSFKEAVRGLTFFAESATFNISL